MIKSLPPQDNAYTKFRHFRKLQNYRANFGGEEELDFNAVRANARDQSFRLCITKGLGALVIALLTALQRGPNRRLGELDVETSFKMSQSLVFRVKFWFVLIFSY